MSASQPAYFNLQQFSDMGTLLVGGRLYTYAQGTTALKTAYTDAAGAVPQTYTADGLGGQYIALNARGELSTPLYLSSGAYDIALKRADGSTVWSRPANGVEDVTIGVIAQIIAFITSLAAGAGSALMGFIQAGAGAVLQTVQAELRRTVSPEQFGALCNGSYDDNLGIMKAINSSPQGASCAIRLTPNKTYFLKTPFSNNNRSVVIDGNNAIILIGANMDYGLAFGGTNCEMRNVQVNIAPGAVVKAGIYVSGLQHVMRNITSRAQNWPLFMLCQDMKESHLENVRVDNDVANKTGIVVQFDYCVNNTVSNSMVGYCAQAFYGSGIGHPVYAYHNEGILFNNVFTVYAGKSVNFDNGTFIAISNCVFDFCETIGVYLSNGSDLMLNNVWIANNLTSNFLAVGTLSNVDGVSITNLTAKRTYGSTSGNRALSLSGPSALVIGLRCTQGMNGGTVTQESSQVIGPSITGGGTNVIANNSIATVVGSLSVEKDINVASGSLTVAGSKGIYPTALSGSATTGANGAAPAGVAAYATVIVGGTTYKLALFNP